MLIVTGTIAYDYIMDFPDAFADHILPEQIHNINLSFIVDKFAKRRGGTAGNVSYALGLLQTPHTLFSVAGKDFSEYKKTFQKIGISLKDVMVDRQDYTATGFAMTDKKDNQIWGYFYGAAKKIPTLKLKKVAQKNDLVLIGPSGAAGSMSFVRQCIELGIDYMFDPGFILTQVSVEDLILGVKHARYLIGNDYEMNLIRKRIKHPEELLIGKTIITTLGEKGAVIEDKGKRYEINRVSAAEVIDPTGAGDAWRAGFLTGLEKNYDLLTCGQMGSVAATFAIEKYGTQEYLFTQKEFAERYRQTFDSLIEL
jgi:adenosine kinase